MSTKPRGRATYPMRIAEPTLTARESGVVPRYTQLFAKAADILSAHPYGTKMLVAEFSTDYGARNTARGIQEGKVKIAPAPPGMQWDVEAFIEDVDGKRVSRLYVSLWPDYEHEPVTRVTLPAPDDEGYPADGEG